ncbi:MAG: hypothetical protein KGK01_19375, partial [Bradyrhizobium sp.]|nr:hypothetical protein [Bradyrhizobium sp.]
NRNGTLDSCFDAFSLREPVSTHGSSLRACFARKRSGRKRINPAFHAMRYAWRRISSLRKRFKQACIANNGYDFEPATKVLAANAAW